MKVKTHKGNEREVAIPKPNHDLSLPIDRALHSHREIISNGQLQG